MSIILLGSHPHPPFKTLLLPPGPYRNTRNTGPFFKIFVAPTIFHLYLHLAALSSVSCFIMFMFENSLLFPLFWQQFLIFIAVFIFPLQLPLAQLLNLWRVRNAFTVHLLFLENFYKVHACFTSLTYFELQRFFCLYQNGLAHFY